MVRLALALVTVFFTHIEGIRWNGPVRYFKSWIPEAPKPLLGLIVPLEVLGQFMRLISLSVRLFANMLAGHMLILVMIGLVFIIHTPPWRFFGLPGALIFYGIGIYAIKYYGEKAHAEGKEYLGLTLPLWFGGIGMVVGLLIYLRGSPSLPAETAPSRRVRSNERTPLTRSERRALLALI